MDMKDGQYHLYQFQNVLRPRGKSLAKESLSLDIFEKLKASYESWTDVKYADAMSRIETVYRLKTNLYEEVETAWNEFLKEINHVSDNG